MKRTVLKIAVFPLLLVCFFTLPSFSQSITGIWRGYFIGNGGEHYRLEFQIKKDSRGVISVTGVSYSWQDDIRFYGKATMTGSFVDSAQNLRIREIKTVEVKNPGGGGTCIMNYDLRFSVSGKEEFLEGTYLGKPEVKGRENPYDWGDCGGGRVSLRRVATTDFYLEPFLRNAPPSASPPIPKTDNAAPPVVKKNTTTTAPKTNNTTTKKPVTRPNNNSTTKKATTKPNNNTTVKKNTSPTIKSADSTRNNTITKTEPIKEPVKSSVPVPAVLKSRQNELMKSIVVNHPDITVKLFDNGEIDDDTISVYLDKRLILSSKRLTASPLTLKFKMDEDNPDHELVMVAENLGRIPPNTSLMIVEAGEQRFEVRITSTEQKNAVVRFRYLKPGE